MFARVVTFKVPTDRLDDATSWVQGTILPMLKQQQGFKGYYAMIDRQTGDAMGISFWETAEDAQAVEQRGAALRQQAGAAMGISGPPDVHNYEVIVHDLPSGISAA